MMKGKGQSWENKLVTTYTAGNYWRIKYSVLLGVVLSALGYWAYYEIDKTKTL